MVWPTLLVVADSDPQRGPSHRTHRRELAGGHRGLCRARASRSSTAAARRHSTTSRAASSARSRASPACLQILRGFKAWLFNLAARELGRDADGPDPSATRIHSYPPNFCRRLARDARTESRCRTPSSSPCDSCTETAGRTTRAIAWVLALPIVTGGAAHRAGRRSGFC